eukprot:682087_1
MSLLVHAVDHVVFLLTNMVVSRSIHMVVDVTVVAELIVMVVATMLFMELTMLTLPASADAKGNVEIGADVKDRREDVVVIVAVLVLHKCIKIRKELLACISFIHYE